MVEVEQPEFLNDYAIKSQEGRAKGANAVPIRNSVFVLSKYRAC